MRSSTQIFASFELLVAAAFWGFGFVAVVLALESVSPIHITFLRFALAGLICIPFLFFATGRAVFRDNIRLALIPALLLTSMLLFQTWGLMHTTATKSGFITTLYVVIVPLMESLVMRRKLPTFLWFCVAAALFGTALIVNLGVAELNIGDFLTLICAFLAAGHIFAVGEVSRRVQAPFSFNIMQSLWSAMICVPLLAFDPIWPALSLDAWTWRSALGLCSLAFGSTAIAFYLQVRAQAHLSATVSSLFFLLESPFAMFFALMLLGEVLDPLEQLGALLIFLSAFAATWYESQRKKFHPPQSIEPDPGAA
jgi:drug/metabolite transporter (DMT)-like permease